MASTKAFIIIAMAAVFLPSILGKEFIVGDSTGWTTNFDYQAWAQDKHFQVGDKLAHNVFKVNGTAFQQCSIPPANEALTTGNDVITLATPGNKWYICGVAKHSALGNMKLPITVQPQLGSLSPLPSPSPAPAPSAPVYCSRKYKHCL
ncbi:hypothetical protein AAG906_033576 [Vitis piasezkii]